MIIRIVSVHTGDEVSRAELAADGTIRYAGADVAQGVIGQTARVRGITHAEALAELAEHGWSNGYLRVAL